MMLGMINEKTEDHCLMRRTMKALGKNVLLIVFSMMIQAVAADGRSAEAIYQKACKVCHASGIAGAPRVGYAADWKARLELSMETLLHSVIQGKGAMPAKGMCMDCTTEDFEAVIRYMMSGQ